ncbi:hypothetical protein SAMN05192583_1393 [Sphingomonas gellani]|uniref:Uncharacterized protein n=1 Tax=Sphingomonas gellani TaxID=1166340 RepID=A0A1H8C1M8_9SPHN|nr:hypothetical protein [Sphingomonas gellani]SEM88324.1 hypothetical protein SAMN05192583_1393 [Sphingomonas gellani]
MAENLGVDLFGDPILPRNEGRGRPEHVWSLENSNKVLLAFASGLSVKDAATAIGLSVPTLRKHYFAEVAKRAAARLRMNMTQLSRLNDEAAKGNVTAEKELFKRLDKAALDQLSDQVAHHSKPAKPEKLGKKALAQQAADEVTGLYETPPTPPGLLN